MKRKSYVLEAHIYIEKQDYAKAEAILQQPVTLFTTAKGTLEEILQLYKDGVINDEFKESFKSETEKDRVINNKFMELLNLETEMVMNY